MSSELILIHPYWPNAPVNWTLSQNLCEIHLRWFLLQLTAFFSCSQNLYGNLFCRTGTRYSLVSLPFGYAVLSLPGSFLCGVRILDAIPSTFGYSVVSLPGSFICDDDGCHAKTLTRRVSVLRLLSKNFMWREGCQAKGDEKGVNSNIYVQDHGALGNVFGQVCFNDMSRPSAF